VFTDSFFTVNSGGNLRFANIILDGENVNNCAPLIIVDGGTLTIETGTVLKNNKASGAGGAIRITGTNSKVIMTGGEITGNTASDGGGIGLLGTNTTFEMSGGSIHDNNLGDWTSGGGVNINSGSTMIMTGGSIYSNHAHFGGGVHINANSSLFINLPATTGNIYNNSDNAGTPNVRKDNPSTFMVAGAVSNSY
jgi:hypothetical protein